MTVTHSKKSNISAKNNSGNTLNVIVNGASGRMGKTTVAALTAATDINCIGQLDQNDNLADTLKTMSPDIVIDFTTPQCVYHNTQTILEHKARPIIGTTGLSLKEIQTLTSLTEQYHLSGLIVPNFSIAAILLMQFSEQAARWIPDVEIIEKHHPQKIDAPSGTAKKTAEMINQTRTSKNITPAQSQGIQHHNVPIHSVRLPGYFAHQDVIFSSPGESLTLSHECYDREAMMPGVLLAVRKVMTLSTLAYGLEHCLF